jgi:hypothetical protein
MTTCDRRHSRRRRRAGEPAALPAHNPRRRQVAGRGQRHSHPRETRRRRRSSLGYSPPRKQMTAQPRATNACRHLQTTVQRPPGNGRSPFEADRQKRSAGPAKPGRGAASPAVRDRLRWRWAREHSTADVRSVADGPPGPRSTVTGAGRSSTDARRHPPSVARLRVSRRPPRHSNRGRSVLPCAVGGRSVRSLRRESGRLLCRRALEWG